MIPTAQRRSTNESGKGFTYVGSKKNQRNIHEVSGEKMPLWILGQGLGGKKCLEQNTWFYQLIHKWFTVNKSSISSGCVCMPAF